MQLLGGLTPEKFLRDYWQQKPLLIRAGVDASVLQEWLSPDELAGLACEAEDEGIESRLVTQQPNWALEHGPVKPERFNSLGDNHWSLLVQDVDKHVPITNTLMQAFDFIPAWRADDLMVSYATDQGGVGPHIDAYDVFLVQGYGKRRWAIQEKPDLALRTDTQMQVLAEFSADETWELEPGDILYVPPGCAHEGVAIGESMTWSVGFRAPTAAELLDELIDTKYETMQGQRFGDAGRELVKQAGRMDSADVGRVRSLMQELLALPDAELADAYGRWIGRPKDWLRPEPVEEGHALSEADFVTVLAGDTDTLCTLDPRLSFTWYRAENAYHCYIAGQVFHVIFAKSAQLEQFLQAVSRHEVLVCGGFSVEIDAMLYGWYRAGWLSLDIDLPE